MASQGLRTRKTGLSQEVPYLGLGSGDYGARESKAAFRSIGFLRKSKYMHGDGRSTSRRVRRLLCPQWLHDSQPNALVSFVDIFDGLSNHSPISYLFSILYYTWTPPDGTLRSPVDLAVWLVARINDDNGLRSLLIVNYNGSYQCIGQASAFRMGRSPAEQNGEEAVIENRLVYIVLLLSYGA